MFPSGYGLSIAVSVLAIMISIGGISVGIGYATSNRKLKEFGKDELNQCLVNGLLIGGMAALFLPSGIVTAIINSATLNSTYVQCPAYLSANAAICFANGYLSGSGYSMNGVSHASILSQSTGLIISLLALNTVLGLLASLKITIIVISFSLAPVLAPVLNQMQFFIKALTTVSISVLVQSSILSVIAAAATTVLLPLGLVLRTFYPTRQVGGFLLGAVIGLYVVFPLTYVLNASIISSYQVNLSNSSITSFSSSASGLNSYVTGINTQYANANSINAGAIIYGVSSALSSISSGAASVMNTIMDYLSYFIMAAFILPAFSIVITSISIKEFSKLLGSEMTFNMFDVI